MTQLRNDGRGQVQKQNYRKKIRILSCHDEDVPQDKAIITDEGAAAGRPLELITAAQRKSSTVRIVLILCQSVSSSYEMKRPEIVENAAQPMSDILLHFQITPTGKAATQSLSWTAAFTPYSMLFYTSSTCPKCRVRITLVLTNAKPSQIEPLVLISGRLDVLTACSVSSWAYNKATRQSKMTRASQGTLMRTRHHY